MTWLKHVTGTTLNKMGWGSSFWLLSRTSSIGFRRRPNCTRTNTRASAGPLPSDFRTSSTTVCSLSQSKFWPCCTVVGARAFGEGERSRSRTRARVTKGRSQSCSTRRLRILFVDFRIAAVLLGPQYGFPRSRVGLAWEPLLIQARSASKGIRDACTSRAEHYWLRPLCRTSKINEFRGHRTTEMEIIDWRPEGIDLGVELPLPAITSS